MLASPDIAKVNAGLTKAIRVLQGLKLKIHYAQGSEDTRRHRISIIVIIKLYIFS